jgi:rare lipoprotein A
LTGTRILTFQAATRTLIALAAAMALGACAGSYDRTLGLASSSKPAASPARLVSYGATVPKGGGYRKLGQPYRVAGQTYVPQEDPGYSKVGIASWYGFDFHGRLTANGEIYDLDAVTAAHPTMPLPSYARVTNLENGKAITVRVNDRGPFAHDRIIDVSRTVARVLDFEVAGTATVRVDYLGPAPIEGSDDKTLLASFSDGKAGGIGGPTILVAAAQPRSPAPRSEPVALATLPGNSVTRPSLAPPTDPLGSIILRSGLSYAPAVERTPAQEAAEGLVRSDLQARLVIAAAKKADELQLRGGVAQ